MNEERIRKMNYNINANWYDCRGKEYNYNTICQKCRQEVDVATEIYEHLSNNYFGELKVHCRINNKLSIAPEEIYVYKVNNFIENIKPKYTPQVQTHHNNHYDNYDDENEQYIEYIPYSGPLPEVEYET
jgi:hypothetical protein